MASEPKHVIKFRENHSKPGEVIKAWGAGYIGEMMGSGDKAQHNGVLIVTDERVAFYRKGLLGEVIETIPLNKISSIERKSMMGHRTIRIHTSHDKLEFKTFEKDSETQLVEAIEQGRHEGVPQNDSPPNGAADPTEMLKKLNELKEMGVLTEDEFQQKKVALLEKI